MSLELDLKKKFYVLLSFKRQREQEKGREREGENPKLALCCQGRARCGAQTHEP